MPGIFLLSLFYYSIIRYVPQSSVVLRREELKRHKINTILICYSDVCHVSPWACFSKYHSSCKAKHWTPGGQRCWWEVRPQRENTSWSLMQRKMNYHSAFFHCLIFFSLTRCTELHPPSVSHSLASVVAELLWWAAVAWESCKIRILNCWSHIFLNPCLEVAALVLAQVSPSKGKNPSRKSNKVE